MTFQRVPLEWRQATERMMTTSAKFLAKLRRLLAKTRAKIAATLAAPTFPAERA